MNIMFEGRKISEALGDVHKGPVRFQGSPVFGSAAAKTKTEQSYIVQCKPSFGIGVGRYSLKDSDTETPIDPIEIKRFPIISETGLATGFGFLMHFYLR